jgi:hypothetical protein
MKVVFAAMLLALTAFYLCTASLSFYGPGETLVFRPFHGLYPHYMVFDPDSPRLARYHGHLPWWQTDNYVTLYASSHETTLAWWVVLYSLGYFATILGWLVFASPFAIRIAQRVSWRRYLNR